MDYNFADDLKAIREILGYTQFEMAEQMGVEQVTISRNNDYIIAPIADNEIFTIIDFLFKEK
ncbi:MAG: hypothetical protein ACI4U5_06790 [Bacilli bacterium]